MTRLDRAVTHRHLGRLPLSESSRRYWSLPIDAGSGPLRWLWARRIFQTRRAGCLRARRRAHWGGAVVVWAARRDRRSSDASSCRTPCRRSTHGRLSGQLILVPCRAAVRLVEPLRISCCRAARRHRPAARQRRRAGQFRRSVRMAGGIGRWRTLTHGRHEPPSHPQAAVVAAAAAACACAHLFSLVQAIEQHRAVPSRRCIALGVDPASGRQFCSARRWQRPGG